MTDDREQRMQAIEQRVQAEEGAQPECRTRRPKEPPDPKLERASEQLGRLEDELRELETTLKEQPVVAALIQSVRHRIDVIHREMLFGDGD